MAGRARERSLIDERAAGRPVGGVVPGRGGRAVLDTPSKQRPLQALTRATRLREEPSLLRAETAVLRHLPSLPAVDLTPRTDQPELEDGMAKKQKKNGGGTPGDGGADHGRQWPTPCTPPADHDPASPSYGEEAAEALGVSRPGVQDPGRGRTAS